MLNGPLCIGSLYGFEFNLEVICASEFFKADIARSASGSAISAL